MNKTILSVAAFSMAMAVVFGALGAHALREILSVDELASFTTGVRYQAWHSLAIFIVMLLPETVISLKAKSRIAMFFISGIILFSFSIYLLATRSITGIESYAVVFGPITPFGGVLLITGWVMLGFLLLKSVK